eukprot:CAMPEP_0178858600 /NCGR_PEP_ID=MMETSP0747-20121128/752_1 /TAXON_ID=913974 /ORGANISM="Nitzschia punctata, Strain CCMP561" /LENGTH=49 /DNA_ID= /DNA_START= /DNA_END= /DNA_ORIENTATION=
MCSTFPSANEFGRSLQPLQIRDNGSCLMHQISPLARYDMIVMDPRYVAT